MDFHERSEEEPAPDLQEVLNVFSALGGSEMWQLEWLIDRVEDRDWSCLLYTSPSPRDRG